LIAQKLVTQGVKLSTRARELLTKEVLQGKDTFFLRRWNWWDHCRHKSTTMQKRFFRHLSPTSA
jgi:hypothetical protein